MELEGEIAAVWRPGCGSGRSMKGRQLGTVSAVTVANPNFAASQTVGFECDLSSIGRKMGPHLAAFLRDQHGRGTPGVRFIRKANPPDIVFADRLLVSEQVALGSHGWTASRRAGRNRARRSSRSGYAPQPCLPAACGREHNLVAVGSPTQSKCRPIIEGQALRFAAGGGHDIHVV